MRFIVLVNTETGYAYMGPDPLEEATAQAREAVEDDAVYLNGNGEEERITSVYVLPYDEDQYPNGNADMAGEYYSWDREVTTCHRT